MARASAFQAENGGSTPLTRSNMTFKLWDKIDLALMLVIGLALVLNPEFKRILALNPSEQTAALNSSFWWIIVVGNVYAIVRPRPQTKPLQTNPLNVLKLLVIVLVTVITLAILAFYLAEAGGFTATNQFISFTIVFVYAVTIFLTLAKLLRA